MISKTLELVCLSCVTLLTVGSSSCYAYPINGLPAVALESPSGSFVCARVNGKNVAGDLSGSDFVPYGARIAWTGSLIRNAPPRKKIRLRRVVRALVTRNAICAAYPFTTSPAPTIATPVPTIAPPPPPRASAYLCTTAMVTLETTGTDYLGYPVPYGTYTYKGQGYNAVENIARGEAWINCMDIMNQWALVLKYFCIAGCDCQVATCSPVYN